MRELVGKCEECDKEVFCLNGFLNGVAENGRLRCFDCADQADASHPQTKDEERKQ